MTMIHGTIRTISTLGCLALLGAAPATQPAAECCEPTGATLTRFIAPATRPADGKQDAAALFGKLKSMVGTWQGEAMGQACSSEYTLTGGGSAVVENQQMHGGMMTMYTLDHAAAGDRVVVTHYCGAGNQPRMTSAGLADNKATFEFLDATGMKTPNDAHMHHLALTFDKDGTVTQDWTMFAEGKDAGVVTIKLKRAV